MGDGETPLANALVPGPCRGTGQDHLALELVQVIGADGVAGGDGDQVVHLHHIVDVVEARLLHHPPEHGLRRVPVFVGGGPQGLVGLAGGGDVGVLGDGVQGILLGQAGHGLVELGQQLGAT